MKKSLVWGRNVKLSIFRPKLHNNNKIFNHAKLQVAWAIGCLGLRDQMSLLHSISRRAVQQCTRLKPQVQILTNFHQFDKIDKIFQPPPENHIFCTHPFFEVYLSYLPKKRRRIYCRFEQKRENREFFGTKKCVKNVQNENKMLPPGRIEPAADVRACTVQVQCTVQCTEWRVVGWVELEKISSLEKFFLCSFLLVVFPPFLWGERDRFFPSVL